LLGCIASVGEQPSKLGSTTNNESSSQRTLGSILIFAHVSKHRKREQQQNQKWIPAFAGMTIHYLKTTGMWASERRPPVDCDYWIG